jgi:hypothetical protein
MNVDDLTVEAARERAAEMRREAEDFGLARESRRSGRARARRRRSLRREATARLASVARIANDILGAIISPPWPRDPEPNRYVRPSAGR